MGVIGNNVPPVASRKGARHEVVFSYDPQVRGAPARGWLPKRMCEAVLKGADVLLVEPPGIDEEARYKDLLLGGAHYLGYLFLVRASVRSVNGSSARKTVHEWIETTYAYKPKGDGIAGVTIINLLGQYLAALIEGDDPLDVVSSTIAEVIPEPVAQEGEPGAPKS